MKQTPEQKELGIVPKSLKDATIEEEVKEVNRISGLWALGYNEREIANKLDMSRKEVVEVVNNNKREWKKEQRNRVIAKLQGKIDEVIDGITQDKIGVSDLKDVSTSLHKLSASIKLISQNSSTYSPFGEIEKGLGDDEILELGQAAAEGLKEVTVSKEIRSIKMKMGRNKRIEKKMKIAEEVGSAKPEIGKGIIDAEIVNSEEINGKTKVKRRREDTDTKPDNQVH